MVQQIGQSTIGPQTLPSVGMQRQAIFKEQQSGLSQQTTPTKQVFNQQFPPINSDFQTNSKKHKKLWFVLWLVLSFLLGIIIGAVV